MSLARNCRIVASVTALALAAVGPLSAHEGGHDPSSFTGVKGDMMLWISDAEGKLIELAEATPEKKLTYRPTKGVRSSGEVFLHVAAANFGIPAMLGIQPPPAGFKFDGYEQSMTKKDDIVKALKDSFAHMKEGFAHLSDADMETPAELFGMKTTRRGAYMLLLSHAHEHLGQSIAYARSNGIVPPWTAREMQAAAAREKKEGEAAKPANTK